MCVCLCVCDVHCAHELLSSASGRRQEPRGIVTPYVVHNDMQQPFTELFLPVFSQFAEHVYSPSSLPHPNEIREGAACPEDTHEGTVYSH